MIILDDPIVNDGQLFGGGIMRMGVFIVGLAMSGPSGVAHPDVAVEVLTFDEFLQFDNLSLFFIDVQSPIQQGNASAIVPTVLQSLETFYDHLLRLPVTYVGNNSTH